MKKTLLIIALIALIIAFEGGRIWYCQQQRNQAEQTARSQTRQKVDSLATADIDRREEALSSEWAARLEQEQQLLLQLKDSIRWLKTELQQARYGNLAELVDQLGAEGISKRAKKLNLPHGKMVKETWSDLRIFLNHSVPKAEITVKLTRPHKQTETVTWKAGEVYYLKGSQNQDLVEVSVLSNTEKQAVLDWQYYTGF